MHVIPSPCSEALLGGSARSAWRRGLACVTVVMCLMGAWQQADAQTTFRMFGHLEATAEQEGDDHYSGFAVGEHDFFVTSSLTDRISFLSEMVINPKGGAGGFSTSIERVRLAFNYVGNHSIIVGKMHTPVNYWNDRFHHGRYMFPTIDRPQSFSHVIPIHTLGLRLQGQNLGDLRFGYDVVVGNGLSSNDRGDNEWQKSITTACHIKPWEGSRIGASYYRDVIFDNTVSSHGGHGGAHSHEYEGDVNVNLLSVSAGYENTTWEMLYEYSISMQSYPDSAGAANSSSYMTYLYVGRRLKNQTDVLYGLVDWVEIPEEDLHLMPQQLAKFGLGWRHEFAGQIHTKTQVERYTGFRDDLAMPPADKWELKLQLAYVF
jgi:hypothetical protein